MSQRSSETESRLAVDFEITFAALLATGLITFPSDSYPYATYLAAFGLFAVTLVRRMAIIGEQANTDRVMFATNPLMEGFSVFSVIYFTSAITSSLELVNWSNSELVEFVGFSVVIVFVAIIFQELVFHDFFIWWARKFTHISVEDGDLWHYVALHAFRLSSSPRLTMNERRKVWRRGGVYNDLLAEPSFRPTKLWVKELILSSKYVIVPFVTLLVMFRLTSAESSGASQILLVIVLFLGLGLIEDQIKYLYMTYGNTTELKTDAGDLVERGVNEIRRPGFTQSIYIVIVFWLIFGFP